VRHVRRHVDGALEELSRSSTVLHPESMHALGFVLVAGALAVLLRTAFGGQVSAVEDHHRDHPVVQEHLDAVDAVRNVPISRSVGAELQ